MSIGTAQLRRLTAEHRAMAKRLAEIDYAAFMKELDDPALFDLAIEFDDPAQPFSTLPFDPEDPGLRRLPPIQVPLGKCAWAEDSVDLPVIGLHCADLPSHQMRKSLRDVIRNLHQHPFARLVFLCRSLRLVPLVGRYGYAYEFLGGIPLEDIGPRLERRYGMVEIRELETGEKLWTPKVK